MAANLKLERDDDRFGGKYYILVHQKNTALMSSGFCQRLDPFRFFYYWIFSSDRRHGGTSEIGRLSGSNIQLLDPGVGK